MIIRPATVWDADKIANLWYAMNQEIFKNNAILEENSNKENLFLNVITRTKLPDWCILIVEEEQEIQAFMMANIYYPKYNNCYILGIVEALYVKPEYRGNGLFKKLIDKMFAWGESKNVTHVEFLSTYDDRMIKLYDRLGYEPVQITYRKKEV
jgi:GNAT superfamily N-acetyltransferase